MSKSLPPVSAKLIADVEQFVAEFKRADNASRRSAASIDAEVGRLTKSIKKKFSASDVGKDLLKGFGIGSGFAVAQQAAEVIAGFWERAANAAKAIEESSQKAMDATLKGLNLRQNEEQRLAALRKDFARKGDEIEASKNAGTITLKAGRSGTTTIRRDLSSDEQEKVHALAAEYAQLGLAVDEAQKKIDDAARERSAKLADSDAERRSKALEAGLKREEEAFDALIKKTREGNEESAKARKEAEELAQKYREIADPALKYKLQIEEINRLHADGKLNANEAADAIRNVKAAMKEDEGRRVDKALDDFFGDLDKQSEETFKKVSKNSEAMERVVERGAENMGDAMIDALSGVPDAWSNLGDSIIHELRRIAIQILVVKPLINSLGGIFGSIGGPVFGTLGKVLEAYGGGKATGGPVSGGVTYRVNENGEEFFKPDVGGTIIPAGVARGMSERKSGMTVFIDATGADSAAIDRLSQQVRALHGSIEHRSVSAVIAAKRRGGSTAAALAS
jgi:hypothetical protein